MRESLELVASKRRRAGGIVYRKVYRKRGKAKRNHREEVGEAVCDDSRVVIARIVYYVSR